MVFVLFRFASFDLVQIYVILNSGCSAAAFFLLGSCAEISPHVIKRKAEQMFSFCGTVEVKLDLGGVREGLQMIFFFCHF